MGRKKLKTDGILFSGQAADEVTGSQYLVKFGEYQCLLECGLHQSSSNNYLTSYNINSERFMFSPAEIDYVFIPHPHIDHCGLLPRLVKEGFCGQIITTYKTSVIMKSLLLNSGHIVKEEARILSKKYKRNYQPLYEESDIYHTLDLIEIYDEYDKIYQINDVISFKWLSNSHCVGAAQLQLIFKNSGKTKKILYTSDLGSLSSKDHYVENTAIPSEFNDVVIMESTYGDPSRNSGKTRSFDVAHLKVAIDTVLDRGGSVVLPCFSFGRTQELLTTLYDIYHGEPTFKTPIIVDSKLSCEISGLYSFLLKGSNSRLWQNVCDWVNVRFISEKEESTKSLNDRNPKIIISSSGFCSNGRVVNYLKQNFKNPNSMIIFSGYVGDNPSYLSYRIKNSRNNKFIKIKKENIPNRADCISLSTFSSHANYSDLITYGSSLNTNRLVLVHGTKESQRALSKGLEDAISANDKTYKVVIAFKGMSMGI